MIKEVEYRFAKDEDGNLVDANEFDPSERRTRKCHCLSCGEVLIPVLGQKRRRHFRHEADKLCNGETYLHVLGKMMLKKRWDEEEHFYIHFFRIRERSCSHSSCKLRSDECVQTDFDEHAYEDLKKFYQTCTVEKQIKIDGEDFRADLLLENESGKDPIMLEVCVSSPSSDKKKASGIRVIEFVIESEEDANSLYSKLIWIGGKDYNIKSYGFRSKKQVVSCDDISCKVVKATLFENGNLAVADVDCKKIWSKPGVGLATGYFRLPSGDVRKTANAFFAERGFDIRSCYHCLHLEPEHNRCRQHRSHKTPLHPSSEEANYCSCFAAREIEKEEMIPGYLYERDPAKRKEYPFSPYQEDIIDIDGQ